jgi:hypothetical protein
MPYLVAALAFVLLMGGSYWGGRMDGKQLCEASAVKNEEVARTAREAAASAAADAIAKMKVRHVTVRTEMEREIREVPVYRDCRHTPDGLQRINEALANTGAASAAGGVVPASGSTR